MDNKEELIYSENGVYHRLKNADGFYINNQDHISTIRPLKNGSFSIEFDGSNYSFKELAEHKDVTRLNNTFFKSNAEGSANIPVSNGKKTLAVFKDYQTFEAYEIPNSGKPCYITNTGCIENNFKPSMVLGLNQDNSNGIVSYQNNAFNMMKCTQNGKHMIVYNNGSYSLERVSDASAKSAKTVQLTGSNNSKPETVLQTCVLTGSAAESVLKPKNPSQNISCHTGKSYTITVNMEIKIDQYTNIIDYVTGSDVCNITFSLFGEECYSTRILENPVKYHNITFEYNCTANKDFVELSVEVNLPRELQNKFIITNTYIGITEL